MKPKHIKLQIQPTNKDLKEKGEKCKKQNKN